MAPGRDAGAAVLPDRLDVVLLAGAGNEGRLREASQEPWEALIPIAGRPMVAYVADALAKAARTGQLVCVGPPEVVQAAAAAAAGRVRGVEAGPDLLANLERGLAETAGPYALVVTSDIPLIKPHMVDDFVRRCEAGGEALDVWYAVVERTAGERAYPGVRRTWVRLRDGTFTGGNLLVVARDIVHKTRRLLGPTLEGRKSPLTLARLLGPAALARFVVGRLSIADVERRVSRLLGIRGRAVVTPYVEIGIDVDKPDDLALARRFLAPSRAGA